MIQQPDLGKKIADLRKAKGLTQEELVDKCNLNVRTLQRIESGEVTPRAHTIRLIFEVLDFSPEDSYSDKELKQKWLEQFYISFIDLFNLKTNTMKKLSILTVSLFLIVFISSSLFNKGNAQNETKPVNNQIEKSDLTDTINEVKFEIAGMFDGWNNEKELIGRDANCIINGVSIKSPIIRLDKAKLEIRTSCYEGILIDYSTIKIINLKCQPIERIVSEVVIKGDEFIYDGKLVFSDKESIGAGKIIISRE